MSGPPVVTKQKWHTAAWILGLLPAVLGCPTEVQYVAEEAAVGTEDELGNEQPATRDLANAEVDRLDREPAFASDPAEPPASPSPEIEKPSPTAQAANSNSERSSRFPWGSGAAEKDSAEVEEKAPPMFADVEKKTDADSEEQAATDPQDDFESFLNQAYGALVKEEQDTPAAVEAKEEPPAAEAPVASVPQKVADVADLAIDPQQAAELEDFMADFSSSTDSSTQADERPPEPKAPAEDGTAEAVKLDDLWAQNDWQSSANAESTIPAEPTNSGGTKSGLEPTTVQPIESETIVRLPSGTPEDSEAKDIPEETPPTLATDVPPAISESNELPDLSVEAAKLFDEPAATPIASSERTSSIRMAAVEPLPPVPVLTFNTRHLAWLLGGKLSLAELAELDGATPKEVAAWREEVGRLAKELRISNPLQRSPVPSESCSARISGMLRSAAGAGEQLRREYGVDHAALLEISLKSNALLMVTQDRVDLAEPVANALSAAADRAMLPRFLWEDTVRELLKEPTPEQAHNAVVRLHERVERFLR